MLEAPSDVKMSDPPLVDGEHCVMFRNPRELIEKLRYYGKNESERKRIAKAGRIFAFRYHNTLIRAKHILRTCLEHFRNHPN